jgi:phosphatidylethanolamine/phosphatidyl-N-methylethanolamine N-methyltransferase
MTTKHIEEVYNTYARVYDFIFSKAFKAGHEKAPKLLELFPGARVLDVGVGTGLSIPNYRHAQIVGVDLSQKMLDQAQKRMDLLGLQNIQLLRMDAAALDFPDRSFDRVQAAYFISTVADPVRVIQEMKRVCRPGGYLVFCNHFQSDNPLLGFFEKALSPLFYRLGWRTDLKLHELMEEAGLEIESVQNTNVSGLWKAVRCVNP